MLLGWILNPVERNVHSRAQSWNTLEEKHAQYAAETEVLQSSHLTLTELMFHVAQYYSAPVIYHGSHALHYIEHQRP